MALLVALMVITVLTLVGASFAYQMSAELTAVRAMQAQQQARFAAETGINWIIWWLRDNRHDVDAWYDNPKQFRRMLVWSPDKVGGSDSLLDKEKVEGVPAWRFSVVGYRILGPDDAEMRYGLTDEGSKLDIDSAMPGQLVRLFEQLDLEDYQPEQLAAALIDWVDKDDDVSGPFGAESTYYMTLDPPYRAKNGPLDTLDELLMVRYFDGQILYGEDYNRNGYLDPNEDDGEDGAWPPDDGDGKLDRGLLAWITRGITDFQKANDNNRRHDINALDFDDLEKLEEEAPELLDELSPSTIEFIAEAKARGHRFRSAAELWGLEVYEDGSTNYDEANKRFQKALKRMEKLGPVGDEEESDEVEQGNGDGNGSGIGNDPNDPGNGDPNTPENGNGSDPRDPENPEDPEDPDDPGGKAGAALKRQSQSIREGDPPDEDEVDPSAGTNGGNQPEGSNGNGNAGGNGGGKGTPVLSPVTEAELAVVMDRLVASAEGRVHPITYGLINVNTAPAEVLMTIPMLTENDVAAIISRRDQLDSEQKQTIAWLATSGALSAETFAMVGEKFFSARSQYYSADVIGFADHVGAARRLQVLIEMKGSIGHVKYYRDITELGIGYPVWDDENSEGLKYNVQ